MPETKKDPNLISGADAESGQILDLHFEGVRPKEGTWFTLGTFAAENRGRTVNLILSRMDMGGPAVFTLEFEDRLPAELLPNKEEAWLDLAELLDPRDDPERVISHSLAGLLADRASLRVERDETLDPGAVTFVLRIGELYEDSRQLTLGQVSDFIEPVETELDPELVAGMDKALGPQPEDEES